MAFDFILMLTSQDKTVADAHQRLEEALAGGVRHIGFKDVGLPMEELKTLAGAIRAAGGRSYLEVVSLDAESELASAEAAVALDVDVLLGGTRAEEVRHVIARHPLRYYPFAGQISGHPSVLGGSIDEIVESARLLTALEHVHGIDLLAYRFEGDVPRLMSAVCAAVSKPVIMAGSMDAAARVDAAAAAGAAGFTVGTAALDGAFPADGPDFADQVRVILEITASARRHATRPRRLALVAHEPRKSQLVAWVTRHRHALAGQRLVATGGTGARLADVAPEFNIERLQRGSRGGDQQLGALIATGELDAVIFFADPGAHGADVDLQALTRLAILHDTPLALSPSAADALIAALMSAPSTEH